MPTYEYICSDCGTPLEAVQAMTDESLTRCPACGGSLRKVFQPAGIMFKGSGFYSTDNRSKKGNPKIEGTTSEIIERGKKEAEKSAPADKKSASTSNSDSSSDSSSGSSSESTSAPAKPSGPAKSPAKEKSA